MTRPGVLPTSDLRFGPLFRRKFMDKVFRPADPGACWEWMGSTKDGYGYVPQANKRIGKKTQQRTNAFAHVISFELFVGQVPDGMVVRHTCHNPICVRPKHLVHGTQKDNVQDSVRAGRRSKGGWKRVSPEEAAAMAGRRAQGDSLSELVAVFGRCEATIRKALHSVPGLNVDIKPEARS